MSDHVTTGEPRWDQPWQPGNTTTWIDSDSQRREGEIEAICHYSDDEPPIATVIDQETDQAHEVYVYNLLRPTDPGEA